jgi:Mor family transcriptional regulator
MDRKTSKKKNRPTTAEIVEEANERAVNVYRRWKEGESYRQLAESLKLSFGRVRQIVKKGKALSF